MPTAKPHKLSIRIYQVGFGDCFLLTFHYESEDERDRHVLIDFGSSAFPKGSGLTHAKVARKIKRDCSGELDVVVATHRHLDHIKGFAGSAGDVILECHPKAVIQPWTENPELDPEAVAPAQHTSVQSFIAALKSMSEVAKWVSAEADKRHLRHSLGSERAAELAFLGEEGIKNADSVKKLKKMAEAEGARPLYVHYGMDVKLEDILPGVKIHVWGPPTLEDSEEIRRERSVDHDEFWHLQAAAGALASAEGDSLFPGAATAGDPLYARWFRQRVTDLRAEGLLRIVRALDDTLNNTSVILLFEIDDQGFLFPGDAQIENWSYALNQDEVLNLLPKVKVYKVGHHGSLNATPKTLLWERFANLSTSQDPNRLTTLLSTLNGKHGHEEDRTEVPRSTLVGELESKTNLWTTERFDEGQESDVVTFEF